MSDVTPSKADENADEPVSDPILDPVSEPLADVTSEPEAASTGADAPVLVEPDEPAAPETAEFRAAVADPAVEPVLDPAVAEPAVVEPVVAEPVVAEPLAVPTAVAAASAVPAQQRYQEPDLPPKKRGNRGIGVLLSIVGALLFAGVYAVVSAVILDLREGDLFGPDFISFLSSAFFWVPVATFLVGLILLVLLLNRAGWWAHVFGSLILAVAVYFGMIGLLLLIGNVFHASPTPVAFAALAVNPWVIAAAVVAREVSIWTGLGIAARGRRVKARNLEARTAFEREQEAKRAGYDGTGTVAAA